MKPRRPYLLRAIYDWIVDSDEVPNILVDARIKGVNVPAEYIRDGQIVLNVSPQAVRDLNLGDEFVMFNSRFSGRAFEVALPIESVLAIYCRDSGRGLAFDASDMEESEETSAAPGHREPAPPEVGDAVDKVVKKNPQEEPEDKPPSGGGGKPSLRLV